MRVSHYTHRTHMHTRTHTYTGVCIYSVRGWVVFSKCSYRYHLDHGVTVQQVSVIQQVWVQSTQWHNLGCKHTNPWAPTPGHQPLGINPSAATFGPQLLDTNPSAPTLGHQPVGTNLWTPTFDWSLFTALDKQTFLWWRAYQPGAVSP